MQRPRIERRARALAGLFAMVPIMGCASQRPDTLGPVGGRLAPCPSSPNCVCSDGDDPRRAVSPFVLDLPAAKAWPVVVDVVYAMKRSTVVRDDPGYLHAEFESALFRWVDDLELLLREKEGVIAVRSAARTGWSDMGVNRRRVEALRKRLIERGVAH